MKHNIFSNFFFSCKLISKKDKWFIFKLSLYALLSAIETFTYPLILKYAVEGIEQAKELKIIILQVGIVTGISLILNIITILLYRGTYYKRQILANELNQDFHLNTLKTDYEKFERPENQDSYEKASRALGSYNGMIGMVCTTFYAISSILSFIIACTIVTLVNPILIILICILAVLKFLLQTYASKKEKKEFRNLTPAIWRRINYTDNISRNLSIGKDLRVYNMDRFIMKERENSINEYLKLYKKNNKTQTKISSIITILRCLDELFLYGFMIYEVIYNSMDIATFTFMVASVRTLTRAIDDVIWQYRYILDYSLNIDDYRTFIKLNLNCSYPNKYEEECNGLKIEFKNVYYQYYMQEDYALEDVSFIIKPHEKIALVGYNGAGKTTLVKLLCGLYHPTKGQILINDIDIETLDRDSITRLIAPVFQDINHYAISIDENIAFKQIKTEDDQNDIEKILRLAGLKNKIDSLPEKEKTIITRDLDDRGVELSGGESQKLGIARSVYKNAPLMILDEPTSALDPLAEHSLYNNFEQIIGDSTAIIISHRLSYTKFCDKIILLNDGKVTEVGNHDELMKTDTLYKKLFDTQAEYYTEEH